MIGFPSFAAIEGAADENSISGCAVGPVIECAEFVEGDVAKESMSLIIEGYGDVAGDAIVAGIDAWRWLPRVSCILRIRAMGGRLIDRNYLLRVCRIDCDRGLGEISGVRREIEDLSVRGARQILSGD